MSQKIFYLTLCAMLVALSYSASAQEPKKVPRIGYLSTFDAARESTRAGQFVWLCASVVTSRDRTSPSSSYMRRESPFGSPSLRPAGASRG